MTYSETHIITCIVDYMSQEGLSIQDWSEVYVGVSKDAEDRLFNGHQVQKEKDAWIYKPATSSTVARDVESHFLGLGCDGGPGGGDETAIYVYAYKKAAHTNP